MRKNITSSFTKLMRIFYCIYLFGSVAPLLLSPSWQNAGIAFLGIAITSIFYFTYFSRLTQVYETDDGLEIEKKGEEIKIPFEDIISIDREGFSWFNPTSISSKNHGTHEFLPADFPLTSNNGIVKDLNTKIRSNQALQTTSASARRLS